MMVLTAINKLIPKLNGKRLAIRFHLPATDETLHEAAKKIGLKQFEYGNHTFEDLHIVGYGDISDKIMRDTTVCELNLLAYKLDTFDNDQREQFLSLMTGLSSISGSCIINTAYHLEKGLYQFIPNAYNYSDLVDFYEKDDLKSVLQDAECGYAKFTPSGFVPNFHESFDDIYDGTNLDELLGEMRPIDSIPEEVELSDEDEDQRMTMM